MKIVVDMCLPPDLAKGLMEAGHDAVHWSAVGDVQALDITIMQWAQVNGHTVITHDLDFGDLLFASKDPSPSVVIIREQDTHPEILLGPVLRVLEQFAQDLRNGSLIAMNRNMARVRRLPLGE